MWRVALTMMATAALAVPLAAGAHHRPGHQNPNLSVSADPATVTFGRTTIVAGRLGGQDSDGVMVELQRLPHPFSGAFEGIATSTTASGGGYEFRGVRPLVHTRYRVIARRATPETSRELTVAVRIRVGLRVGDSTLRRGQRVRFSGFARPRHDGAVARIQRRTATGSWRTVARARLADAGDDLSRFSRRLRVYRDGTFRALVPADADHAQGRSRALRLDVR